MVWPGCITVHLRMVMLADCALKFADTCACGGGCSNFVFSQVRFCSPWCKICESMRQFNLTASLYRYLLEKMFDGKGLKKLQLFNKAKQQCLNKEDLSRKGSIDEPIRPLVDIINANPYYYTTSTCSGRISLIVKPRNNPSIKKGGIFLLNSHEEIDNEQFDTTIESFINNSKVNGKVGNCLWLKFEPFIMHIQCLDLDKARCLLNTALVAGCRNSGITLGKKDKFLVAVRSTSSMEVPLHNDSEFVLDNRYIKFLSTECNRRLKENLIKLEKFHYQVLSLLSTLDNVTS